MHSSARGSGNFIAVSREKNRGYAEHMSKARRESVR
jgi:hypothetical protein